MRRRKREISNWITIPRRAKRACLSLSLSLSWHRFSCSSLSFYSAAPFLPSSRALWGASQFRDTKRFGSIESELLRALSRLGDSWRIREETETRCVEGIPSTNQAPRLPVRVGPGDQRPLFLSRGLDFSSGRRRSEIESRRGRPPAVCRKIENAAARERTALFRRSRWISSW